MTELSNLVILLNFLRTFLMSFLMIRWVILSMMKILQTSTHSTLARVRISLLIAEMRIFELIVMKTSESRFVYFHSMIFLTIMLINSLSKTSTWTKIQWMWISWSHFSSFQINVCSRYWFDCFLRHWITRMTTWQFVKIAIDRFLRWFSATFKIRSSFTIFSK